MTCEINLTFDIDQAEKIEALSKEMRGWKFTRISSDPMLGGDPYCYLTNFAPEAKTALLKIERAKEFLAPHECVIRREKIEVIIYDHRFVS